MKKYYLILIILVNILFFNLSFSNPSETDRWVSIPTIGPDIFDILCKKEEINTLFAITRNGLFATNNAGMNWELLSSLKGSIPLNIDIDNSSGVIYLATRDNLFKSTDGGKTLINIGAGILRRISWIKVIDSMKIFCLSDGKLYRTINGGKSWADITPPCNIISIDIDTTGEVIYISAGSSIVEKSKIFYSENGGETWLEKECPAKVLEQNNRNYDCEIWHCIRIHPLDNKQLFGFCQVNGWGLHIVKSIDNGKTWKEITPTKFTVRSLPKGSSYLVLPSGANSINFDVYDEKTFYILNVISEYQKGFLKTTDGGNTYEFMQIESDINLYKIVSSNNSMNLYAATSKGIFKSSDGGKNWIPINIGFPLGGGPYSNIGFISLSPQNFIIYNFKELDLRQAEVFGVIYESKNAGLTWSFLYSENYKIGYNLPSKIRGFQCIGQNEIILEPNIIRTKEINMTEWKEIKTPAKNPILYGVSESNSNNIYVIDKSSIYASEDKGLSWYEINSPIINIYAAFLKINGKNQIIYLLGDGNKLFKSEDGGQNWVDISPKELIYKKKKDAKFERLKREEGKLILYVDYDSPDIIYLGNVNVARIEIIEGREKIFVNEKVICRSINGGKTWELLNEGFGDDVLINCITTDPKDKKIVYAGTSKGVFRSSDNGFTWKPFNNGLPSDAEVLEIKVNKSDPQLIVLKTNDGNIWVWANPSVWNIIEKSWEFLWNK